MAGKENTISPGRIESAVQGFADLGTPPSTMKYGDHKTPGTQGAPIKRAGRGGAPAKMYGKLGIKNG